jgi:hypothetical protein
MDILSLLTIPYGIISLIILITFFIMAYRLKKIYFILDYFYQKDKNQGKKE